MKKWFSMFLVAIMMVTVVSIKQAEASWFVRVGVEINDVRVQFPDQGAILATKTSRVYVPVRFVSETLGAKVDWDVNKQQVTVTKDGKKITIDVDKDIVEGKGFLLNGRTMVPLRFVSEQLGAEVKWDNTNRIAKIYDKNVNIEPPKPVEFKDINGYKVPEITDVTVKHVTNSGYDIFISVDTVKPLAQQHDDLRVILTSKHGPGMANQVVEYVKLKTKRADTLPVKYFMLPSYSIMVHSSPYSYEIDITVRPR